MATHHSTVNRCREQIRVLSESHSADSDSAPHMHLQAMLGPTDRCPTTSRWPTTNCASTPKTWRACALRQQLRVVRTTGPRFVPQVTDLLAVLFGLLLLALRFEHEHAMVGDHGHVRWCCRSSRNSGRMSDT